MISLWKGEVPLADAFWWHAIIGVSLLNLVCTFARFLSIAEGGPLVLTLLLFVMPLPYGVLALVGVWRSSRRSFGPIAALARWTAVVWGVAATVV